jgi:hypothetical protein
MTLTTAQTDRMRADTVAYAPTTDPRGVSVVSPRQPHRHGRDCAGRCITRAYALASLGVAVVAALHVALHW